MDAIVNLLLAVESLAASPMGPVLLLPLVIGCAWLLVLIARALIVVVPLLFSAPARLMLTALPLAALGAKVAASLAAFKAFVGKYR